MHPNARLIESFYTSFQQLDAEGMIACYTDSVCFSDPVFPDLRGQAVGTMWRMLCDRAQQFKLTYREIEADDANGSARWDAQYRFSATGRTVHNRIAASFAFSEGKISRHVDRFSLWKWSAMALGPAGMLLGWTPMMRARVRKQAAQNLARFAESPTR